MTARAGSKTTDDALESDPKHQATCGRLSASMGLCAGHMRPPKLKAQAKIKARTKTRLKAQGSSLSIQLPVRPQA